MLQYPNRSWMKEGYSLVRAVFASVRLTGGYAGIIWLNIGRTRCLRALTSVHQILRKLDDPDSSRGCPRYTVAQ